MYDDQIEEPSDGLIVSDITSSGSATAAMEESVPSETVSAGTSDTADPAAGASFTAVFENGTSAADVEAGTTATSKDNTGTDGEDKVSEIFQTEDAKGMLTGRRQQNTSRLLAQGGTGKLLGSAGIYRQLRGKQPSGYIRKPPYQYGKNIRNHQTADWSWTECRGHPCCGCSRRILEWQ